MNSIIVVPVDGSAHALQAVDWLLTQIPGWKSVPTVHLLNVQASLHGDISRFISESDLQDFHRESGEDALAPAQERFAAAGVEARAHVRIGEAATLIDQFAREVGATQIVMGSRGHGGIAGTLFGSVASRLAHLSGVPLTLVR